MPTNDGRRPFTEIFEICQKELVREAATGEEGKYKGFVNQVYINEMRAVLPERYLRREGFITTVAQYTTGTVTVGTGTANIKGASTSWTSGNSDDRLIKIQGMDRVFRVTFSAGTSLTFQDSLTWTGSSGSGLTYTLFQDRYAVASNFDYMMEDDPSDSNIVYRYQGGNKVFLEPKSNDEYDKLFNSNVGTPYLYTVKVSTSTAQNNYIHTQSNPSGADQLGYAYIPILTAMKEYTTGTATFTTGTAVVGASTLWTSGLTTSNTLYIRNDADGVGSNSLWHKIISFSDDSHATLSASFSGTSGAGITYTISDISLWPSRFDDIIMYKAAWIADPDGKQAEKWNQLYQEGIGLEKRTESKRNTIYQLKEFPGLRRNRY